MTNQNDLMRISNNLSSMQDNFLNRITNSGFFSAFNWLEENQVKELESSQNIKSVWSKLLKVFLVDWLICVFGVLGTGILFVVILNFAH